MIAVASTARTAGRAARVALCRWAALVFGAFWVSAWGVGCASLQPPVPFGNRWSALVELPNLQTETFDSGDAANWSPDTPGAWRLVEGRYIASTKGDVATASLLEGSEWTNVFVEADYIREAGSVGAGGLVVRASADLQPWVRGTGYLFALGSDGRSWQAAVIRQRRGAMSYLCAWTNVPGLQAGTNRIGARIQDRLLQLYVNGSLIWEGLDAAVPAGQLGLFASCSAGFESTHAFDLFFVKPAEPPMQPAEQAAAAGAEPDKKGKSEKIDRSTADTSEVSSVPPAGPDRSPLLRPGLLVRVSVLVSGKREIDSEVKRVTDNHQLDLPLIGIVSVEGMSLRTLNEVLQARYREFFINPQVVAEFVVEERADAISPWGSVTVLGRVRTPGRVNIPPTQDLTVSAAIQQAGGFDTSAKTSAIRITRRKPDGKTERITVDFTAVGQQGEAGNDLLLKSGDIIFVPERVF